MPASASSERAPRTDAPDIGPAVRPFRLEGAGGTALSLFTEEERAALYAEPDIAADDLARALHSDEQVAIQLLRELHAWEHAAANDPRSDPEPYRRNRITDFLTTVLLERAVRSAHQEQILWSPLLSEVIYEGADPYERDRAWGDLAEEEQKSARSNPRRHSFLCALAHWMVGRAGTEEASALLAKLPHPVRHSLLYWVREQHVLTPEIVDWLLQAGGTRAWILATADALTQEAARALGERLVKQMQGGPVDTGAGAALRALRERGLWEWQAVAGDMDGLLRRARESRPDREVMTFDDAPPFDMLLSEWEAQNAHRKAAQAEQDSGRQIQRFLIDQADRGRPFPRVCDLLHGPVDAAAAADWVATSPWRSRDSLLAVVRAWDSGEDDLPGPKSDWANRLAADPDAIALPEVRVWMLENTYPTTLLQLLNQGVWAGEEAGRAFRRAAQLRAFDAAHFLKSHPDVATALLCRDDLMPLLSSPNSEARLIAIQLIGTLPEERTPVAGESSPSEELGRSAVCHFAGTRATRAW
jgi:hypothetical protein